MSTQVYIGLCIIALVAAMWFGYCCAALIYLRRAKKAEAHDALEENIDLLSWVARQAVADLINCVTDRSRLSFQSVIIDTAEAGGRFTCSIKTIELQDAVIRVTVLPVTEWRIKASVVYGHQQRTFYYIRTFELQLTGLDEKIEVSE